MRVVVALILSTIAITSAGCSKFRTDNKTSAPGGGHTDTTSDRTSPASSGAGERNISWDIDASSLNGTVGQTFTFSCAGGGTARAVWGSDIYTADSSICTAAVHSGLVNAQQGGTVTIELRPGRTLYGCSERNGVTTNPFGSYPQSFVFKTPNTEAVVRDLEDQTPVLWNTSAAGFTLENGKPYKFKCPSGGPLSAVWGTDIYTLDSSICTAAVHVGKLMMDTGGLVSIELRPGESEYKGSTRNGVTTNDYGNYSSSFVIK